MPPAASSQPQHCLVCANCGHNNLFNQPYPYHAGFSDAGFLYNEAGNATLVWNMYDPYFAKLFPDKAAWMLGAGQKQQFESLLPLSPKGDRWLFSSPARCGACHSRISEPMGAQIYYLIYPSFVNLSGPGPLEHYISNGSQ